jgi:hypothetical protein
VSFVETSSNIFKNKIFSLPADPNILEYVSGSIGIFFSGLTTEQMISFRVNSTPA